MVIGVKINHKGHSLIELAVSILIISIISLSVYAFFISIFKTSKLSDINKGAEDLKLAIESNIASDCSWGNTLNASANSAVFSCLKNGSTCSGGGSFNLYGDDGNPLSQQFAVYGQKLDVKYTWSPVCSNASCTSPDLNIVASLTKHYGNNSADVVKQYSYFKPYLNSGARNCKELRTNLGLTTQDGVYYIDPDGFGGKCGFKVYCRMTDQGGDGGGWALAANANGSGYSQLDVLDIVKPTDFGILPDDKIQQLLQFAYTNTNNIKLEVDGITPTLSSNGNFSKGIYQKQVGNCPSTTAGNSTFTNFNSWYFLQGDGDITNRTFSQIGFSDRLCANNQCFLGQSGYLGFYSWNCGNTPASCNQNNWVAAGCTPTNTSSGSLSGRLWIQ